MAGAFVKEFKRWLKSQRIGVLMGGDSAERDISLKTGRAIFRSLERQEFSVTAIDARVDLPSALKRQKVDVVYLALHGPGGEDGTIQGLLEWLKIPYTGSGVLASALAMDKIASKRLFDSAGLRTAPWFSLLKSRAGDGAVQAKRLGFPLVVKPASQGSAIGVSIVRSASEWSAAVKKGFEFGPKLLVERFLEGPEITVGIVGEQSLPIIEIVPSDGPFYDFHAKYAPGGSQHILPARLPGSVAQKARLLALSACGLLGTKAVARVDLIVDRRSGPTLLEVNTIPGMTETSLLPEAAQAAGMNFDQLVLKIAEHSFGV